jgi:hypothetical protein
MQNILFNFLLIQSYYDEILRKEELKKKQNNKWIKKVENLEWFEEIYGHTNVPQRYTNQPSLGQWVGKQRVYFRKKKLPRWRIKILDELKFNWEPGKNFTFDSAWNKRFLELQYFKTLHGHCNVPCKFGVNKELGNWVKNQRQFYKKNSLSFNRINLLNSLGFEWERRQSQHKLPWIARFEELKNYFYLYGNTRVRQRCGALGKWVQKQRDLYKKNRIDKNKKELLDSIGFEWIPQKQKLQKNQSLEKTNFDLFSQNFFVYFEQKISHYSPIF